MASFIKIPVSQRALKQSNVFNIIYVGENLDLVIKLKCLDGLHTIVTHYENSIVAYHDIKQQKVKPDMLLCDSNMIGINAIELFLFTKKITHLNVIYAIVANHKFSSCYDERLRNLEMNNIIKYPIQLSVLSENIRHIIEKNKIEKSIHIISSPSISVMKRTFGVLYSFFA